MRKRLVLPIVAVALALVVAIAAILLIRRHPRRHRVFRAAPAEKAAKAPATLPPVEQWSEVFSRLNPADLEELLDRIEKQRPDLYSQYSLAYLDARVLIERNELNAASKKLAPYLETGSPFRDLALYHQGEILEARGDRAAASRVRQELIARYPRAVYRDQAIDDEVEFLTTAEDVQGLIAFADQVGAGSSTARRRDLSARIVELQIRAGRRGAVVAAAIALLGADTADDASDRVSRALDRPELIASMDAQQKAMLGDAFRNHRHFDRAVALLSAALPALPARRDELQFQIGRSYFGNEKYALAQQSYLRGANQTADRKAKATFLFHASRAFQLSGDDAAAERLLTAAIAVPGRYPATTAALTQRIRTRAKQKRFPEAGSDLQQLRGIAPKDHALAEGALAYACAMLAAGNEAAALSALGSVPAGTLDQYDRAEFAFWRARCLERRDPHAAFLAYLSVLRASVPTHFAYFARQRLLSAGMQQRLTQELETREAQVRKLVASKQFAAARQIQTDRILLSTRNREEELRRLASIYRQLPAYDRVLELTPEPLPSFPGVDRSDRGALLTAMGLYDEAADDLRRRYPLRPARSALTQSLALSRGNASRDSIYAVEVLMNGVPGDFLPALLPMTVRQLLYPRYFDAFIVEDSRKYGADPTLVLSIMREESRFNPRAKSEAAARGLLQFIITTARDIGRAVGIVDLAPEDLYDPRVIIQLGAKYVSELSGQFEDNHYMTAAAYNAGPKQVALWARLAPAPGDDWFLSAINFDETKHYVRKVMNSYRRYGEIYGGTGPQGGLRAEP